MKKRIPIPAPIVDARGSITNLLEPAFKIKGVLLIVSRAGAVRANHYHRKDSHYVYILKGKMEYTEKDMRRPGARKKTILLREGDLVLTPPMTAHAMRFLEDTVFLALTTEKRDRASYERDTRRIQLIEP
ncbi:MAG TPA: cupin domain-containing protein [Acidobacteriota bacterium]|nr:cupin domain-containing protein [Acidobacteriota bacterium]